MKHLGDITKIDWSIVEPVDVVTGGSPCQDLSIAGKRKGLAGERSGLFMEQIRCVKELRKADELRGRTDKFIRPRYMVWENVPGAFSSGNPKGADFAAVIEEIIKVAEPDAIVRVVPPDKGWNKSGCYYSADGRWSVAWRLHDAQFWGVPQRRKRIALVADFGGLSAPEILFERKGLSRDIEQSGAQGEETARAVGDGVDKTICYEWHSQDVRLKELKDNVSPTISSSMGMGGANMTTPMLIKQAEKSSSVESTEPTVYNGENITSPLNKTDVKPGDPCHTLGTDTRNYVVGALSTLNNQSVFCLQGNGIDRADTAGCNGKGWREDVSYTLNTIDRPAVYSFDSLASNSMKSSNPNSGCRQVETAKTLDCFDPNPGKNQGGMAIVQPVMCLNDPAVYDARSNGNGEVVPTLTGDHQNRVTDYTALCVGNGQLNQMSMGEQANTLDTMHDQQAVLVNSFAAGGYGKYEEGGGTETLAVSNVVRRLTPLECERLQGYPDGWTDIGEWIDSKGKKHKEADSPRYKALGNSIALPFWKWLLKRISAQYERDATLGSLFDGIGGFLIFGSR